MTEIVQFTGQMIGGPDDGNMVTASVRSVQTSQITTHRLDGPDGNIVIVTVEGTYEWDETTRYFRWKLGNTDMLVLEKNENSL